MDRITNILPHFLVGFAAGVFAINPNVNTLGGFTVASILWILALISPRLFPVDKPTELKAQVDQLDKVVKQMEQTVLANAEYSAKEFGTIKTAIQLKQLGR